MGEKWKHGEEMDGWTHGHMFTNSMKDDYFFGREHYVIYQEINFSVHAFMP
jgi:hypothetical protein